MPYSIKCVLVSTGSLEIKLNKAESELSRAQSELIPAKTESARVAARADALVRDIEVAQQTAHGLQQQVRALQGELEELAEQAVTTEEVGLCNCNTVNQKSTSDEQTKEAPLQPNMQAQLEPF